MEAKKWTKLYLKKWIIWIKRNKTYRKQKLELIENKNQNLKKEKNLKNEYYDISASTIINKIMINYKNNTLEQIERKITYKPNPRMNNKKYIIRLAIVSFDDGLFLMFKFIS